MSETETIIDIPNSGGLQIIERTITKKTTTPLKIEREIIDVATEILKKVAEEGAQDCENGQKEVRKQLKFNKELRVLFKILRTFPNNALTLRKLREIISNEDVPWRILSYAEHIPESLFPLIVSKIQEYIEQNKEDLYIGLELTKLFGVQLSHLACFPHLDKLLSDILGILPPDIATQILRGTFFEDELEERLIEIAARYSNSMTENQSRTYLRRRELHERRQIKNLERPSSLEIPQGGTIFQIFPDDIDGHKSYIHFKQMLGEHKFTHEEIGGIHIFQSKTLKFIVNDPSCGCDENIQYCLEQNEESIDMCIIRGHSGLVNIYDILSACDARIVMIGGCESSKTLRKDVQDIANIKKTPGIIQGRFFITSNGIGKMGINDRIIDEIIRSAEGGKTLETKAINGISGGTYDVFYIDE